MTVVPADQPRPAADEPVVRLAGVSKSFGGAQAVKDVSLSIRRGEVHALVGENGAGKSTLCKLISGLLSADTGELYVDGHLQSFSSPREALAQGVATIAQELALVPELTVAANVYLGVEPRLLGFVRRRALSKRYTALSEETGFALPGGRLTRTLRTADQQKVEILRAMSRGASVIIMDEPTAALSREDTARLHDIIRQLARGGCTVVLISHFLTEVLSLADTVSVMRDGVLVRTRPAAEETEATPDRGHARSDSLGSVFPAKPEQPDSADQPAALEVQHLSAPGGPRRQLQRPTGRDRRPGRACRRWSYGAGAGGLR